MKADARLFEIDKAQAAVLVGVACLGIGIIGMCLVVHEALLLRRSYLYRQIARAIYENTNLTNDSSWVPAKYLERTAELAVDGVYFLIFIYTGCRCLYKRALPRWELITCLIASFIMACNPFFPMSWGHFFIAALLAAVVIADSRLNEDQSPQPEPNPHEGNREVMHSDEYDRSQN